MTIDLALGAVAEGGPVLVVFPLVNLVAVPAEDFLVRQEVKLLAIGEEAIEVEDETPGGATWAASLEDRTLR